MQQPCFDMHVRDVLSCCAAQNAGELLQIPAEKQETIRWADLHMPCTSWPVHMEAFAQTIPCHLRFFLDASSCFQLHIAIENCVDIDGLALNLHLALSLSHVLPCVLHQCGRGTDITTLYKSYALCHRAEVMELQEKFERDKRKIAELKAARRFKPY